MNKVAVHEAGHAIVGFMKGWKINSVTIVPDAGKDSFGNCDFASDSKGNLKDTCMIFLGGLAAQRVAKCEDTNYQEQDDYKTALKQVEQEYKPAGYEKYIREDIDQWLSETATLLEKHKNLLLAFASTIETAPDKTINGEDAERYITDNITPPNQNMVD